MREPSTLIKTQEGGWVAFRGNQAEADSLLLHSLALFNDHPNFRSRDSRQTSYDAAYAISRYMKARGRRRHVARRLLGMVGLAVAIVAIFVAILELT